MNTEHTPGPWNSASLDQDSDHIEVFAGISDGDQVAVVKGYGLATGKHYEAIANARLIAAAPDLLAALDALIAAIYEGKYVDPYSDVYRDALNAIAKATGPTNL